MHWLRTLVLAHCITVTATGLPKSSTILKRLADRAEAHQRLLYKIQCDESITRVVQRSKLSAVSFGVQPEHTIAQRHRVLILEDASGKLREQRLRLDGKGKVRLSKKGTPVEARLPLEFAPVSHAFPHAQVAWFTAEYQEGMRFAVLDEQPPEPGPYRIECPEGDIRMEFEDAQPPRLIGSRSEPRCNARPSGQMCLDGSGEIRRLAYYGTFFDGSTCRWDRSYPFAVVEQEVLKGHGALRFPRLVVTAVPMSWRDTAVFVQEYTNCEFAEVEVRTK